MGDEGYQNYETGEWHYKPINFCEDCNKDSDYCQHECRHGPQEPRKVVICWVCNHEINLEDKDGAISDDDGAMAHYQCHASFESLFDEKENVKLV